MPPLDMGEPLEEVGFKHSWRGDEKPVRVINDIHVLLSVEVPDLREEGLVWVYDSLDVLLEGADNH